MDVILKTGKVGSLREATITTGDGRNGINSHHSWSFRINDMPVTLKGRKHFNFAEGDIVSAAGKLKNGTLEIYAYRNETTGAYETVNVTGLYVFGTIAVIFGLPASLVLVGIPVVWIGYKQFQDAGIAKQANALLNNQPRLAAINQ